MKKKLLSFVFAFSLIITSLFLLSACDKDKKLNYIQVSLADGGYSTSIYETRDFGNTTGLNNIKIKAHYSDGSDKNVELTNVQIAVSFSADGSEQSRVAKTFEEYTQMCEDSNLTAGSWKLTLKYKDNSCEVYIGVSKVNNTSNYTLNVTSKVENIGENQIYYGTKLAGINYSVFNGNTQLDDSMIEKICILNKVDGSSSDISSLTQEEIKALPKPSEIVNSENYIAGELSYLLEDINPGKYLIFAEIKEQENYLKSYSDYQTLVIKKSQIVATAENFKIDFTFNQYFCKGVTLDEMLHGISNGDGYSSFGNSKINGKLSLLFNSDLDDGNNNSANDNKLTRETFIWHNFENSDWDFTSTGGIDDRIAIYGTLAEVNPKTYNFDSTKGETNTITTKVKFVPKGDEYGAIYAESKEFEITIILHRTAYSAPTLNVINELTDFKYSTENNGNPEKMKFDLSVPDYALIPYDATQPELAQHLKTAFEANKAYCIYTNAKFEKDDTGNYDYVCSSAVGSYFIKCYINPNLYYNDEIPYAHRNITITKHDKTSDNEGYIEYSWTISKGNIAADQSLYPANDGGQIKFNTDNKTVELKFGGYDSYKDVNFVWEAQAAGTHKDEYNNDITSNITGRFEPIAGKDSRYKKFVLETDLTTVGSTENYYDLYIKISYSGDDNWDPFEQYILVQIYKNN